MKDNLYIASLICLMLFFLLLGCEQKTSIQRNYRGIKYYKNNIQTENTISKTISIYCEDQSDNEFVKKKYIIKNFLPWEVIHVLRKKKNENLVFFDLNINHLYYLQHDESGYYDASVYAKSVLRYYFDVKEVGKSWISYEDNDYSKYCNDTIDRFGLSKIYITLVEIKYLNNDTLYFFKHQTDQDGSFFEYYLIDKNLNLHELRTTYNQFEIRYVPEEQ